MRFYKIAFFCLTTTILFAEPLKPYDTAEQIVKDLQKNIKITNEILSVNELDRKYYELLGKAVALRGIICKKSEITPIILVQRALEVFKTKNTTSSINYLTFTENCRNMYGLYR